MLVLLHHPKPYPLQLQRPPSYPRSAALPHGRLSLLRNVRLQVRLPTRLRRAVPLHEQILRQLLRALPPLVRTRRLHCHSSHPTKSIKPNAWQSISPHPPLLSKSPPPSLSQLPHPRLKKPSSSRPPAHLHRRLLTRHSRPRLRPRPPRPQSHLSISKRW